MNHLSTLVDLLYQRAEQQPHRRGYTFLLDGESEESYLSYAELAQSAQTIAMQLHERGATGQRALLLYTPGLAFVKAFFGCLLAGVVAVPSYPPRRKDLSPRLQAIIQDAEPAILLCDEKIATLLDKNLHPMLARLPRLNTERIGPEQPTTWSRVAISPNDLAFLQYTSGSTASPKGVMISHGNLMHNLEYVRRGTEMTSESVVIIWLPLYHDMGLINILEPFYTASQVILFDPIAFLAKPLRWLQAISKYRGTTSGGPHFAYELCLKQIAPAECQALDLSCWDIAFNGAEPIRADTLARFAEKFTPYGFRPESFYPCYGLAESTLLVSGGQRSALPILQQADKKALQNNLITAPQSPNDACTLVGCGTTWPGQEIAIVDPESCKPCPTGQIGEVWVSGPSVAQGYWHRSQESAETFQAMLTETSDTIKIGPFLRTGDLGFLKENELFITGRLKDLIIIHGQNHYPQDIERTVEESHVALQVHGSAAFTVAFNQSQLVVVAELQRTHRRADVGEVIQAIRSAVSQVHDLALYCVVLIKPGRLPKTTSGKIQRYLCREQFLAGVLPEIGCYLFDIGLSNIGLNNDVPNNSGLNDSGLNDTEIADLLKSKIGDLLGLSPRQIDLAQPINRLGLGSVNLMVLKQHIESQFQVDLPADLFFEEINGTELISQIKATVITHSINGKAGTLQKAKDVADSIMKNGNGTQILQVNAGSKSQESVDSACHCSTPIAQSTVEHAIDGRPALPEIHAETYRIDHFPEVRHLQQQLAELPVPNPYFKPHHGINGDETRVEGRTLINFAGYNYVGLSGHPFIQQAVQVAVAQHGTSVSASRLASGEIPLHRTLEEGLANFIGVEDCLVYVGGFTTNVTTIGHLLGPHDLICYDELIHNSALQGMTLSGAIKKSFPHNDWQALDELLTTKRQEYRRILIVIEGVYSMDGDIPVLPQFVALKQRHKALLMVDEAHSIGVLGAKGRGIAEHFGIDPTHVDIWMGTLSKSFASCGGYIAGSKALVNYLKYTAPGFVYSVGMSPQNTAAALAALQLLQAEPERVDCLRQRSQLFLSLAQAQGLNTGDSHDSAVIPIIVGDSQKCMRLSHALSEQGISVLPIIFPAVAEDMARLRFFISSMHTEEQIRQTVDIIVEALKQIR